MEGLTWEAGTGAAPESERNVCDFSRTARNFRDLKRTII